jgi:hypothetical protein
MISAGGGLQAQPPGQPVPAVRIASPLPVPTLVSGTVDVNVVSGAVDVKVGDAQSAVNFTFSCRSNSTGCGPGVTAPYVVPSGQRLVIEYASVRATQLPAGEAVSLGIQTLANGVAAYFWLQGPVSLGGRSATGQSVKLYADPDRFVVLFAERASGVVGGAETTYEMSFSGHLVPIE